MPDGPGPPFGTTSTYRCTAGPARTTGSVGRARVPACRTWQIGQLSLVASCPAGCCLWETSPSALHRLSGRADRKSVVEGKSVSVRVDLRGRRHIKQTTTQYPHTQPDHPSTYHLTPNPT